MKRKSLLFFLLIALLAPLAMNGQTTLLSQNFDGTGFTIHDNTYSSSAWYTYNAGTGNNWELEQGSYANSGNYCMSYPYDGSNAANCYLVSEPFSVSSTMTQLSVSLYERVRSSTWAETFEVFFVKAGDVTTVAAVTSATKYNAITSADYTNTTYTQVSGSTTNSALKGQSVRVVVHCTSAANKWYLYIDDITVTETASAVSTYTVTYNANGGTGTMTDPNSPYTSGSTVTVMSNAFTAPSDMTFSGWNTAANGSGTSYAPGDHFNISANITLYAQWAAACDYFEDFENVSGASSGYSSAGSLPTGWDQIYGGTVNSTTAQAPHVHSGASYPGHGSGTNALSNYYLGFYGTGTGSVCYAIMPALPANEAANHISFKYRYESTSNGTISYGVINGTDASTYVQIGTCSNSDNNGLVDVALNVSQTAGKRIAFCWNYSGSSWYTAGIDDICVMTESTSNCSTPTNVTVSNITPTSANVNWDGEADSYNVRYRTVTKTLDSEVATFFQNFDNSGTGGIPSGWSSSANDYSSTSTNWSIRRYNNTIAHSGSYSISSRSYDGTYDRSVDNQLVTPQVTLDGTLKFWMKDDGTWHDYIEVYVSTDGENFTRILVPGEASSTWTEVTVDLSSYAGQQGYILIRHFDEGKNYIAIDDFGIYTPTYSYTYGAWQEGTPDGILSGLSPETLYEVQVQADCDSDGTSAWTDGVYFETLSACAAPVDLSATIITATTATLGWSDYQDSYNVRYRGRVFFEDFNEGIPSTWTTIDSDGDGYNWGDLNNFGIDNSDCASSASYINDIGVLTPDNWLISPQLDLQGFFEVWLKGQDANDFEEHYAIYLSTVGNTISNFTSGTLLAEGETTNSYQRVTADLSQYAGQQGYIAIRHYSCTNQYWFCVDNFGIYTNDWITTTATDATTTLTGLTPTIENGNHYLPTNYEWQVQGINCDGNGGTTDWSAPATFTTLEGYVKHIDNWSSAGYYLISSPIATDDNPTNPEDVTNMLTPKNGTANTYDLYRFDQAQALEWRNYRQGVFNLEVGKGYLYGNNSNSEGVDLVFTGTAYSGDGVVPLTKTAPASGLDFPDWNLVGNPFPVDAYIADQRSFYTMNSGANEIIAVNFEEHIEPMTGVFVVYDEEKENEEGIDAITFTTTMPSTAGESVTLDLRNGNNVIDRAIVRFDEGQQLPKFQLNRNSTKLYIPQEGKDYAVVCSEEMGAMPVNFKAEDNGTYTLNFSCTNVGFAYLHLIDNKTGNDVDLLQTPSYSFEAKTTDYESRFKLVFATGDNSNDDNFAFFSNGSFVINNDGAAELQVIDLMGRILSSETINGCTNVNVNAAPGVYMLRLINGTDVKVQKVVVK